MKAIIPGIYEHYKGKKYRVIGEAKHSETMEDLVLYEPLYDSISRYWVRPKEMFLEEIEINGKTIPRFKFISKEISNF